MGESVEVSFLTHSVVARSHVTAESEIIIQQSRCDVAGQPIKCDFIAAGVTERVKIFFLESVHFVSILRDVLCVDSV